MEECSNCKDSSASYEIRESLNELENVVFVHCCECNGMIYARRESKFFENPKWKARAAE